MYDRMWGKSSSVGGKVWLKKGLNGMQETLPPKRGETEGFYG